MLRMCLWKMWTMYRYLLQINESMEDLTDMQNYVLPYLQSFCNLEEKGVKERREQQIVERNEGRADELGTSTKANAVVKDAGKADRKPVQQKQAVAGKDKSDRGDDLGVRTVQNKHNESEVTNDNVASGFFGLE